MLQPEALIPVPGALAHMRRFPLDGALLLFDRETGWNALCEGSETAHLRQRAPRVIQFGITNDCNLACTFCSRDPNAASRWTSDAALELLSDLAAEGVLEVAFGGGDPFIFPGFVSLIRRIHDRTPLAVNITTNGLPLIDALLRSIRGVYGELRLSLYEDNHWRTSVRRLVDHDARFGVNLLVTPGCLRALEATIFELVELGCRDVLLLSYNGRQREFHLDRAQWTDLAGRVAVLARALQGKTQLKLDICWGERMAPVPRLFARSDCGAGRDYLVITSDKRVMPCSFHHWSIPIDTAGDVMRVWREARAPLSESAADPGCARQGGYGFSRLDQVLQRVPLRSPR